MMLNSRRQAGRHCERSEAIQERWRVSGLLRRFAPRNDGSVIASEATQSRRRCRCWIASSLTLLVLLRHNICRLRLAWRAPQHGHRGKLLAIASIRRIRMVAIEFGMCR
jgi:hypothetical protein